MKERPIIFGAPMVHAILEGRKTQTRRIIATSSPRSHILPGYSGGNLPFQCPYGQTGDRLWVRETFSGPDCMEATAYNKAAPPSKWGRGSRIWYWADGNPPGGDWTRPRPSIHMPRWASRITLEVTGVQVERLQDITPADCVEEGYQSPPGTRYAQEELAALDWYRDLWEQINGPGSWDANPWVWVISFRRVDAAGGEA